MAPLRRILLVVLLAGLVPLPPAEASHPFPGVVTDLLEGWVSQARSQTEEHANASWWNWPEGHLSNASRAAQEGRARTTLFELETHLELVLAHRLVEQTRSREGDEARRHAADATGAWARQAQAEYEAFRARLHDLDGQVRSVQAAELCLYAADLAIGAKLGASAHASTASALAGRPLGVPEAMALVRASHTPLQQLAWAHDLLDAAGRLEGLPPRLDGPSWARISTAALQPRETSPDLAAYEGLAAPARENGEALLAIVLELAEARVLRAQEMDFLLGDAASRGRDPVADAAQVLRERLAALEAEPAQARGILDVFTADASDRARATLALADAGEGHLVALVNALASLDHARLARTVMLEALPESADRARTPGPALPLALLGAGAAATVLPRRSTW